MLSKRSGKHSSDIKGLSAERSIRVWTIQRACAWELFQTRGVLRGDGRRVWHSFRKPYRWHLSRSWREGRAWDRKTEGFDQFNRVLPQPLEQELQATWPRVFDLELIRRAGMWGPTDTIQGVSEYIRLDEVREVTEFVSR